MSVSVKSVKQAYTTSDGYNVSDLSLTEVDFSRHITWLIEPERSATGLPTTSAVVFRIKREEYDSIEELFLDSVKTEQGTGAATLVPMAYKQSLITIGLNNDPSPVQTLTDNVLFFSMNMIDPDVLAQLGKNGRLNMSTSTFNREISIAQSGVLHQSMPILGSLLTDNKIDPRTMSGDILIYIYRRAAADQVITGSGVVHDTTYRLRMITRAQPDMVKQNNIELSKSRPSLIPYVNYTPFHFSQTLTAGTNNDISLSGHSSECAFMVVMIRSSVTGSGLRTFTALGGEKEIDASIDILDNKGVTVLGSGALPTSYLRSVHAPMHLPGKLVDASPVYFITFCEQPVDAFLSGKMTGILDIDGSQKLRLTPASAYAGGTSDQWTFVPSVNGSAGSTGSAGSYQLVYNVGQTPGDKQEGDASVYYSSPLAFGATAGTIDTAITAMGIPDISVSSSGTMNSTTGVTLTTTAASLTARHLSANGAQWSAICALYCTTAIGVILVTHSQTGVLRTGGFTTGTYNVDGFFCGYERLKQENGKFTKLGWH